MLTQTRLDQVVHMVHEAKDPDRKVLSSFISSELKEGQPLYIINIGKLEVEEYSYVGCIKLSEGGRVYVIKSKLGRSTVHNTLGRDLAFSTGNSYPTESVYLCKARAERRLKRYLSEMLEENK